MARFAYNNAKNTSSGYTSFELNYGYHLHVSYKGDIISWSRSKAVDKIAAKFRKLITVYKENLQHAQEIQKRAHDKNVKPRMLCLQK